MAGYIGEKAKRRKRNIIFFAILFILAVLFIYIVPSFKLSETLPSDSLLPNENEIKNPTLSSTIEELELKIFDKEQKIIFRNKQIEKIKNELKILKEENLKLSKLILDLKTEIDSKIDSTEEIENVNKKINKIKDNSNKEIQSLKVTINNITSENNNLIKKIKENQSENDLFKKEYKSVVSKNLKILNLQDDYKMQIQELKDLIEEQNLLIKVLQDISHHG